MSNLYSHSVCVDIEYCSYMLVHTRLESIMLQNLHIVLSGISSFICFLGMHYAGNFIYNCTFSHKNDHDRNKM